MVPVKKLRSIFVCFCLLNVSASAAVLDSIQIRVDSSLVEKRVFSNNFAEKYRGDEFDYTSVEGEAQNFISRALEWFFNKLGEIFGFKLSPEMYQIVELIVYIALGILVLYLVIRFMIGSSTNAVFSRKSAVLNPLNISEEHIENVDLDQLIQQALRQSDYRLAIRYMYLRLLKQLSRGQLIEWHFDKTNNDYYKEIEDPALRRDFKQVSYLYDHIWYGEFSLDQPGFHKAKADFERLTKTIADAG